jgi:hypothetical protein
MSSVSGTNNPTNLREIARKHVVLSRVDVGAAKAVQVTKLDLTGYAFKGDERVVVVARAGNTSRRYELGTVASISPEPMDLSGLDLSRPLRFRLLVRDQVSPRLRASAENLRCTGDGDVESLLPMVSAELGQRIWRLAIGDDGVELLFNGRLFQSGASAEGYAPFRAMVLPEAARQVFEYLAKDPERLNAENSVWVEWAEWMRTLRIEVPPPDDEELRQAWVEESTAQFCDYFKTADDLQAFVEKGGTA